MPFYVVCASGKIIFQVNCRTAHKHSPPSTAQCLQCDCHNTWYIQVVFRRLFTWSRSFNKSIALGLIYVYLIGLYRVTIPRIQFIISNFISKSPSKFLSLFCWLAFDGKKRLVFGRHDRNKHGLRMELDMCIDIFYVSMVCVLAHFLVVSVCSFACLFVTSFWAPVLIFSSKRRWLIRA